MDYYLKFETEEQAAEVLYGSILLEESGEIVRIPRYQNTDVIGTLYDVTGEEPVALDGWHVNVRLLPSEDSAPLEPFATQPAHPRRVFA